jgi:hypothetical protein
MPPSPIARLRKICLAFPGAHEVEAWGEATFRVNNKLFAMYSRGGTHHAEVDSVWIKATPINQGFIIAGNPKRYFLPPYVDLTVTKKKSPKTRPAGSSTVQERQRRAERQARRR